jgi:hypothetical protein
MNFLYPLIAVAAGVIALFVMGHLAITQFRNRPGAIVLTAEERAELANLPKTATQKLAWAGLTICTLVSIALIGLFQFKGGAVECWQNDDLRLQVYGMFLIILLSYAGLSALAAARCDERDRNTLRWAPLMQANAALLTLAAWLVFLGESYHDQESVPKVYMNLIFGSVLIVHAITHFAGILVGYWATHRYA